MLIIGGALMGLTSFGIAYNISSDGKVKRFIEAYLPEFDAKDLASDPAKGEMPKSTQPVEVAKVPKEPPLPAEAVKSEALTKDELPELEAPRSVAVAQPNPPSSPTPAVPATQGHAKPAAPAIDEQPMPDKTVSIELAPLGDLPAPVYIPKPREITPAIALAGADQSKPKGSQSVATSQLEPPTAPPPISEPKKAGEPASDSVGDTPKIGVSGMLASKPPGMLAAAKPEPIPAPIATKKPDVPEAATPPSIPKVAAGAIDAQAPVDPAKPAIPANADRKQGDIVRDCAECPELIVVSAGTFMMHDELNPAAPPKPKQIDHDFAIARHEVTFTEWDRCAADGACPPIADDGGWGRSNRPAIFVSYEDITQHYLPWLSRVTGKTYRLPNEEEWEYASVGGAGAPQEGGKASQGCSNVSGASPTNCKDDFAGTAPVGSFAPNRLGLHDMNGNVWEWVDECWRPFTYSATEATNACESRVVLGGAWSTEASVIDPQIEGWEKVSKRKSSIGFRVARSLR